MVAEGALVAEIYYTGSRGSIGSRGIMAAAQHGSMLAKPKCIMEHCRLSTVY